MHRSATPERFAVFASIFCGSFVFDRIRFGQYW
jgi:hypothetical protein